MNAKKQLSRRDAIARILAIGAGGLSLVALGSSVLAQRKPVNVPLSETDPLAIIKSPSGIDQAIRPLTDNVPLTIFGRQNSVKDVLDIFQNPSGFADRLSWKIDLEGGFVAPRDPNGALAQYIQINRFDPSNAIFVLGGSDTSLQGIGFRIPQDPVNGVNGIIDIFRQNPGTTGGPNLAVRALPFDDPGIGNPSLSFEFFSRDPLTQASYEWLRFLIIDQTEIDIQSLKIGAGGVLMDMVWNTFNGTNTVESFRMKGANGTVDRSRLSFSAGKTPIQHNRGINEAAPGGANLQKAITFTTAEEDANYGVLITPQGAASNTATVAGASKTVNGFTINYNVAGGFIVDWMVFR